MVSVIVRQGTTDDTDAAIFIDCSVHQLSVSIGIISVICAQIFMFIFVVSGNSTTFTPEFRRHSGGVRKDFYEKGVIEVIFMDNKADIVPTPLFYTIRFLLGIERHKNK
jgi:hypothetical protein